VAALVRSATSRTIAAAIAKVQSRAPLSVSPLAVWIDQGGRDLTGVVLNVEESPASVRKIELDPDVLLAFRGARPAFPVCWQRSDGRKRTSAMITPEEHVMKLSARNQIPAVVTGIQAGEAIANVELDANGVRMVASITVEAVRQLGLAEGSSVVAIIKASDVIVATAD
jgi:molybdopterin-binding protein